MWFQRGSALFRHGLAVLFGILSVAAAYAITTDTTIAPQLLVVVICALVLSPLDAVLCTVVAALGTVLFAKPTFSFAISDPQQRVRFLIFIPIAAGIISLAWVQRRAVTARLAAEALRDSLIRNTPLGVGLVDTDLSFVSVNEEWGRIDGVPAAAHVGRPVSETSSIGRVVADHVRSVLASGDALPEVEFISGEVGERRPPRTLLARFFPVRDDSDRLVAIGAILQDVTQERAAAKRVSALAELGRIFDDELDVSARAVSAAHIIASAMGSWAAVSVEGLGVAAAFADGDGHALQPNEDAVRGAVEEALERGATSYAVTDECLLVAARVPTVARVSAVVVMALDPSTGGDVAVEFVRQAAERVGVALGNAVINAELRAVADSESQRAFELARLETHQRAIATTLQQSLLPAHLPLIPELDVATLFIPSGELDVGGDTYDVVALDDHCWLFAVVDVCGHGSAAAAVTALVRHTIRAEALRDTDPARVLANVNQALIRQPHELSVPFVTAAVALVEPHADGRVRMRIAFAGHEPALLRRADGSVVPVHADGVVLGALESPRIEETSLELLEGDVLMLYTDGITEARDSDGNFFSESLSEVVASALPSPKALLDRIEEQLLAHTGGRITDDVAAVAISPR